MLPPLQQQCTPTPHPLHLQYHLQQQMMPCQEQVQKYTGWCCFLCFTCKWKQRGWCHGLVCDWSGSGDSGHACTVGNCGTLTTVWSMQLPHDETSSCTTLFLHYPLLALPSSCTLSTGWMARPCLLAWLYAFYCFDYSWATTGVSVQKRIGMFEADWPFYLGVCEWICVSICVHVV